MASAASSSLNVNRGLTTYALDFGPDEFIADRLFPAVSVRKNRGKFVTYDRNWQEKTNTGATMQLLSDPREKAKIMDISGTTSTYVCKLYRLAGAIDTDDMNNIDGPLSAEALTTRMVRRRLLLQKEDDAVTLVGTTGNYLTGNRNDLSGTGKAQWDETTSTGSNSPVRVVLEAKTTMKNNGGPMPNVGVAGYDVHHILLSHKEIRDRISSDRDKTIENIRRIVASVFGLDEYHVVNNVQQTAQQGKTAAYAALFSDSFALIHRDPQQNTASFHFGTQFQRSGFPNAGDWVDPSRTNTRFVEVRDYYDFQAISNLAGFRFIDVLT